MRQLRPTSQGAYAPVCEWDRPDWKDACNCELDIAAAQPPQSMADHLPGMCLCVALRAASVDATRVDEALLRPGSSDIASATIKGAPQSEAEVPMPPKGPKEARLAASDRTISAAGRMNSSHDSCDCCGHEAAD